MSVELTPFEELAKLYAATPERNFGSDIAYYFQCGYILSGPNYLAIFQRVRDGWQIHAACGRHGLREFCELMPYYLPYVGWARQQRGRSQTVWRKTEDVLRKVGYTHDQIKKFREVRGYVSTPLRGEFCEAATASPSAEQVAGR